VKTWINDCFHQRFLVGIGFQVLNMRSNPYTGARKASRFSTAAGGAETAKIVLRRFQQGAKAQAVGFYQSLSKRDIRIDAFDRGFGLIQLGDVGNFCSPAGLTCCRNTS
jgi:hypothetical protein